MNTFMMGAAAVLAVYRGAQRVWEWTGAALFPRFWSGPLDPTGQRMFQDAAGTTRATAAGQPVGKLVRADGSIDATQATALSRPTLARHPKGGRRNFLPFKSKNFLQQGGALGVVVVSDNIVPSPYGGFMQRLREVAGGTNHQISFSYDFPVGEEWTFSFCAKAAERQRIRVVVTGGAALNVVFDLNTGAANVLSGGALAEMVPLGNGVYRVWVKFSASSASGTVVRVRNDDGTTDSYSGVETAATYMSDAQLERGPLTPYQDFSSANDITEPGVPDVWHLWNDGGDSLLAPLPTGAHEVATVGIDGRPAYASLTGDGSGKNILLGADRIADIFVRAGALTDAERARLEEYWQQRLGAGYLISPGMVPGVRRMWQDATATMPAVDAGSPVGLLAFSDSWNLGPQLAANADFGSAISPWVIQNPSETHTITHTANGIRYVCPTITPAVALAQAGVLVTGKRYLIEVDVSEYVSGSLKSDSVGGVTFVTGAGKNYLVGVAGGTTLQITRASAPTEMTIRSVKAYEIVEPVAAQPTALSRPTLARWPKGGRRNLWKSESDLVVTDSQFNLPRLPATATIQGISRACTKLVPNETVSAHWEQITLPTGVGPYTQVLKAKADGYHLMNFFVGGAGDGSSGSAVFNLLTGVRVSGAGAAEIYPLGDGWYLLFVQHDIAAVSAGRPFYHQVNTGAGDGVSGILVADASIYKGSIAEVRDWAYQSVTSAFNITEAGVPDVWHLFNDGGDSLPAVLPAGAWGIAWVTHLGVIGYARVTSDGTNGIDLLRAERMADVAVKRGRFTSYEKAQLETQWGKYKP